MFPKQAQYKKEKNADSEGNDEYLKQKLADDFKAFSFSFWKICKQRIEKILVNINEIKEPIMHPS